MADDFSQLDEVTWSVDKHNVTLPDPTGWWCPSLDDTGNGTNTLYDLANGNDGALMNMEAGDWVADTGSGGIRALVFDGTNEIVDLGAAVATGTGAFSFCAWIKTSTDGTWLGGGAGANGREIRFAIESGVAWTRNYNNTANGGSGFADGNWHHICFTKPANGTKNDWIAYKDGVPFALTPGGSQTDVLDFSGATNTLIADSPTTVDEWNGSIDDVRIFNSVLSEAEVSKLASRRGYVDQHGVALPVELDQVGWWCPSLDNTGNGTNTLYDLAKGNDGTLINMEAGDWVADTSNGGIRALDFDGWNEYVDIGNVFDESAFSALSVFAWINLDATPPDGTEGIVSHYLGSGDQRSWMLGVDTSEKLIATFSSDGTFQAANTFTSSGNVGTGGWAHVGFIWDGSDAYLYINGSQDGTNSTTPATLHNSTGDVWIGAQYGTVQSLLFNGLIDDVRIFNSALSQIEILKLASQRGYVDRCDVALPIGKGFEIDLDLTIPDESGWWCPSLDDTGDGTNTLYDLAFGNDGTLINMEAGDWVADTSNGGIRALDFDGSDEYVSLPIGGTAAHSTGAVSLWFYTDAIEDATLFWAGDNATTSTELILLIRNDSKLRIGLRNVGTYAWVKDSTSWTYSTGRWYHLCLVQDGVSTKVYIDNTLVAMTDVLAENDATGWFDYMGTCNALEIGRSGDLSPDRWLNGRLDDVRIFPSVPSVTDIEKLASRRGYNDILNLTGIEAAPHGTILLLFNKYNASSYNIVVKNLNASSSAGSKFQSPDGADVNIRRAGMLYIRYNETFDSGNGAWHLIYAH